MADDIRHRGHNFDSAEKRVHGVEAPARSHEASITQHVNRLHNLEHPIVLSLYTGEVGEAKVPATEVIRITNKPKSTSAKVATLTGGMHHWESMSKQELAKVEARSYKCNGSLPYWNKVCMDYMRSGRKSGLDPMAVHPK